MWYKLKWQVLEAAEWLRDELEKVFMSGVEGVGGGSVNGETKKKIVVAVEKARFLLLTKSLEQHRPIISKQVLGWKQRQDHLFVDLGWSWSGHQPD